VRCKAVRVDAQDKQHPLESSSKRNCLPQDSSVLDSLRLDSDEPEEQSVVQAATRRKKLYWSRQWLLPVAGPGWLAQTKQRAKAGLAKQPIWPGCPIPPGMWYLVINLDSELGLSPDLINRAVLIQRPTDNRIRLQSAKVLQLNR
jgi:hypothetical protein